MCGAYTLSYSIAFCHSYKLHDFSFVEVDKERFESNRSSESDKVVIFSCLLINNFIKWMAETKQND